MERPDLERIKQELFSIGSAKNNPIVQDFEAVLVYALQLEASLRAARSCDATTMLKIYSLRKERDEAREMLGECFVLSGADTDGDGWRHNWPYAVLEVKRLRQDYDESTK